MAEWQPIETAPRDGRWCWGEWPEQIDRVARRTIPKRVSIMRWGRPEPQAEYLSHWLHEGRWTPGDDPVRWAPIEEPFEPPSVLPLAEGGEG